MCFIMFYPFSIVLSILYDLPCRQLTFYVVTLKIISGGRCTGGSFGIFHWTEVIGEFRWEALGLAPRISGPQMEAELIC